MEWRNRVRENVLGIQDAVEGPLLVVPRQGGDLEDEPSGGVEEALDRPHHRGEVVDVGEDVGGHDEPGPAAIRRDLACDLLGEEVWQGR